MTTITLHDDAFSVTFTTGEKVAGLIRDQRVPFAAVRAAEVVPDGVAATRGLRAPGLGLPRVRKIGTWRRTTGTSLVSVRAGHPALRVTLEGHRYGELLLDVEDAPAVAAALTDASLAH